jgi:translocation and assembly module TamB
VGATWTARRRLILFVSSAVSVLALAAALLWLPDWSHTLVLSQLQSVFDRPVHAESVRFRFFPAEMEILRLRVDGARPGDLPWLEVPRISILPSFGLLWERRIVLSRVRIEKPVIRVQAFAGGGDNLPRLNMGGRGVFGIRIRRLVIESGLLILDHERVPLDLDLPELSGHLSARRAGILAGELSLGPGTARFGTAPPIALQARLDVVMEGSRFALESGHVRTTGSDLAVAGELRLGGKTEGHFRIDGTLDLAELDRHVTRTGFDLAGSSQYGGDLEIDGSRLALRGRVDGQNGSWKGTPVSRFKGEVAWNEEGVRVHGLDMQVLGGVARLDLDIPPAGQRARIAGRLERLDADVAVSRLFGIGTVGAGAAATGDVLLEWPRGRFRNVSGEVRLDLAALEDRRTPVSGRFEWSGNEGAQRLEHVALETPAMQALLRGRIARNDRADIALTASSSDLSASDDLILRIRRALGNARAEPFAVAGTATFDGHWRGTVTAPIYDGRLKGAELKYANVDWGRGEWVGRARADEIECHSLVLRKAGSELWVDGTVQPGDYGQQDAVAVRVRLGQWPAEDLVRAFEWDARWTGPISGTADIAGRRSAPQGSLAITGSTGRYFGVGYETLRIDALLRGDHLEATRGEAKVGDGRIQFTGTRTDAGDYDGELQAFAVEIEGLLPPLRPGVRWGGHVSGRARLQGTLEKPTLEATLTAPRVFLNDEGMGALSLQANGGGDGGVEVRAQCDSPRMHVAVEGVVQAAAPYVSSLVVRGRDTSLDPFVRALSGAESAGLLPPLVITGDLAVAGPLARPAELTASMRMPRLEIPLPEYPVRSDGAFVLDLVHGRLTVHELRLKGEGTNLVASGEADVLRDGPLDFSVKGDADLRALAAITRRFRARGAAHLGMSLRGTRDAPRLDGTLQLLSAGVRVRDFPHGLEDVQGSVRFTERAARFEGLVGHLGGGEVVLTGETTYGREGLRSIDLSLAGRDLALRYPEGLRSLSDGDLRLFGDGERQWLTGSLQVRQALWTRRYDVASEILAAEAALRTPARPLGEALRFDIKVSAPGTLKVDNNLASLEARADLRLQGTADNPVVVGRADVDRGRVYFQGNTYVIHRGRIEFSNPQRLDPFFDIEAETRLRSYRINLRMSGTLARVSPTLTSDPPLSAVQILSLLAGSDEAEVARLDAARTDRGRIAEQGAASLAAAAVTEGIGLERHAERLFGLNRFTIDPAVLKGHITNPAARVTVGKRLTPDLSALYSVDLNGSNERLLSVEYTLKDWLSVLMTHNDPGGFGIDARVQRSR